ncbi:DUF6440 family protein [Anaerosporobacter faecicola]|uniref:DUF6440 family protein n=1 Tax=Anaerosporobacter faecicola TaxID=2718714 RepID=UPI0014390910|nr:DUF6440 family protein [Anaerosporobacter faecicola]
MFSKEKKDNRFIVKDEQRIGLGSAYVLVDKVTGVNYLVSVGSGYGAITPLLDAEGKVVVDPSAREYFE